ncbi:placenta-specific protein 9 isoform 2-T2 [Rhinophrynus dorsalis]
MGFMQSINMRIFVPAVVLLLVVINSSFTAADPTIIVHRHPESGNWCNEHRHLHRRLDVIEERAEKTVEYLYSEVNSLLESLSAASWALPSVSGAPLLDIFEEDSR